MDSNNDTMLAVVVERVENLTKMLEADRIERRDDFDKFRQEVRTFHEDKVGRGEWEQRNQYSDTRFLSLGAEISEIKQDIVRLKQEEKLRRTPIATVITIGVAVVASLSSVAMWLVSFITGQ